MKSINTKLMLGQLLVALLGVVALALCGYVILYTSLMTSQREKTEYVAESWGRLIDQNFSRQIASMEEMGQGDEVNSYSTSFWEGALTLFLAREAGVRHWPLVSYLNEQGHEEVKVLHGQKGVQFWDHGSSPLFKKAKANPNRVVFRIATEADNDTEVKPPYLEFIYYAETLGDFAGVIMARAPVDILAPSLAGFRFEKSGFVALLNKDGVVLEHPDKNKLLKTVNLSVFPGLKNMSGGKIIFKRASVLDMDQYNAIVYLPRSGILINASLPRHQFMAVPNNLLLVYLAVILFILSLCLVVSFILARGITRPILDLASVSNQLAQGDWQQEIDTSSSDEIGVLAKSFELMKHRLHDMIRSRDQEILAREKSERKYRTLFDAAPDAVSILDHEGMVLDVNSAACGLYGVPRGELLGQHSLTFIDKNNWPVCRINFQKLATERADVEEEIAILYGGSNEDRRPVWRKARALDDENGRFSGVLVYDRDISGQKELERLREDLERIARHDLKTPLNGVINIPYLIRRENNLSDNQLRWLQMIEDSGYKMLDLINRSLDMYRMESGTYEFQPVGVDLVAVVSKITLDLTDQMQTKRLELDLKLNGAAVQDGDSFLVPGDELLCYSMLANLIKNAIEASPVGKGIAVSLDAGERRSITIHNWGTVDPELRDCFFSKYSTAGKKCGTGLGTYSAMLMARTQRGDITMRSSNAEGTFITVFFVSDGG